MTPEAQKIAKEFGAIGDYEIHGDSQVVMSMAAEIARLRGKVAHLDAACVQHLKVGDELSGQIARLRAESAKWKDEYHNVCKFANDYEAQRDTVHASLKAQNALNVAAFKEHDALRAENKLLRERVGKLREGLKFYARIEKFTKSARNSGSAAKRVLAADDQLAGGE